jgi:O-antigen/teichoic acid export membrane protein
VTSTAFAATSELGARFIDKEPGFVTIKPLVAQAPWIGSDHVSLRSRNSPSETKSRMPTSSSTKRSSVLTASGLFSSAASTSGLTAIYTLLLLVATILLARWLGPAQYGVYALVTAVAVIVGLFATPGTENVLIRDLASYGAAGRHGTSRGLLTFSNRVALITSIVLVVVVSTVTWVSHSFSFDPAAQAMLVGSLIIPISALSRVRAAALSGLHRVVLGRVPELVVRPIVLLVLVVLAVWVGADHTAAVALGLTCVAYGVSYVVGAVTLRRAMPRAMREAHREYDYPRWLRSMPSFLALGFSDVLTSQLSITLIGWFGTARDAGVFAVANRGAAVVALGFAGVAAVAAPRIARLWAQRDMRGLDALLKQGALLSGGVAALAVCVIALFRDQLLAVFGPGFVSGGTALVILSLGQLAFATIGIQATALLMTGGERKAAFSLVVSLVLTTVLSALLISPLGENGAALAWTISMVLGQLLTIVFWRRHRRSMRPVGADTEESTDQQCAG